MVTLRERSLLAGYIETGYRTDQLKYSFVVRTVPEWNRLPTATVEAVSADSFKAQLAAARQP